MKMTRQEITTAADISHRIYDPNQYGELDAIVVDNLVAGFKIVETNAGKVVYVVVQGSNDAKDWMSNVDKSLTDFTFLGDAEVHRGFDKVTNKFLKQVVHHLNHIKLVKVIFTGHSLGAAVATILYARLRGHFGGVSINLITFGSPRVGNHFFCQKYFSPEKCLSISHIADPVTRMPKLGYSDLNSTRWIINSDLHIFVNPTRWQRIKLRASLGLAALFLPAQSHSIPLYRAAVYHARN